VTNEGLLVRRRKTCTVVHARCPRLTYVHSLRDIPASSISRRQQSTTLARRFRGQVAAHPTFPTCRTGAGSGSLVCRSTKGDNLSALLSEVMVPERFARPRKGDAGWPGRLRERAGAVRLKLEYVEQKKPRPSCRRSNANVMRLNRTPQTSREAALCGTYGVPRLDLTQISIRRIATRSTASSTAA